MKHKHSDDAIGYWVAERTGEEWHPGKGSTLAFLTEDDQIACGLVFYETNGKTVWAGLAIDHSFAEPAAFHMVADYVYNQLGCDWVRCKVAASNVKSLRLVELVGFELETRLQDSHPTGDELIYRMHRSRCPWLDLEQTKRDWKRPN